jgi:dTDP-4-amino-4,6-dideoxygalactose transaminase
MLLVAEPNLGEEEKRALANVIDSNWITMGDRVRAFEVAFAAAHGATDAVAVSSCTAGLNLVVAAHGIGPGDEVLVPALSFVATANCVLHVGAMPVFVDIDDMTRPLMSLADAEVKCNARTRAVVLMHYAGFLSSRAAWRDFAGRHGLVLIEDAAHAVGAEGVGEIGNSAVFSFYGNKNMTTAEGGMIVSDSAPVLDQVRLLRGHGMTSGTRQRQDARTPTYDVTALGWNYRMDELRAAVGLVQLKSLARWNAIRRDLTECYRAELQKRSPDVLMPFAGASEASAYHLLAVVLPEGVERATVMARLRESGVQTTIHYPPIHLMTYYRERFPDVHLPLTEAFASRQLTLPLHPKMHPDDVRCVADSLADAIHSKGGERL